MGNDDFPVPSLTSTVLRNAPIGVAVLDADLRYRWVNDTMARFNGRPADDHVGRTLHEVIVDAADDLIPLLKEVLATGRSMHDLEAPTGPAPWHPGRPRLWRLSLVPAGADDGGPGVVVFARDATDQRDAEVARSQSAYRTERFAALAAAVAAAVSVEQIADLVHDLAGTALGATACGIALRDANNLLVFAGQAAADKTGRWAPMPAEAQLPPASVLRSGEALFIPHPEALLVRWPHLAAIQQATGDQAWAALPLRNADKVIGVLAFAFPRRQTFWSEDRQYLASVAGLTSQALQRAYAHQREHSIAHTLQQTLLPTRLPAISGMNSACRYRAADNSADVGGDFYDLFTLDEQTITAVIGDICSGGLAAAAMVGQVRFALRALANQQPPEAALRALNGLLLHDNPAGRFLTAACLRVTLGDVVTVTTANGGHPPPLLVGPDRSVRELGAYGTLLGGFPNVHLHERTDTVQPGSALVLYTDGVIEAPGADGQYGEQRLIELLRTAPNLDADVLADRILAEVTAHETYARDDIALLVLTIDEHARAPGAPSASSEQATDKRTD